MAEVRERLEEYATFYQTVAASHAWGSTNGLSSLIYNARKPLTSSDRDLTEAVCHHQSMQYAASKRVIAALSALINEESP